MPDNLNIQMISQIAIAANTIYLMICPKVLGSVRIAITYVRPKLG